MKNKILLANLKKNIITKNGLKGTLPNSISYLNTDKNDASNSKDINFNINEIGIMMNRDNIKRFRKLTK